MKTPCRSRCFARLAWLVWLAVATSAPAIGSSGAADAAHRPRLDHFDHFTIADGLPGRRVHDLHQDRQGFLWLATQDGLARFDGHRFVVFVHDPADPGSLPENYVTHIAEDSRGDLWLTTTTRGLARFDLETETFEPFPLRAVTQGLRVWDLQRDGDLLWLDTSGRPLCFDLAARRPCADPSVAAALAAGPEVFRILEDRRGDFWLLGSDGMRRLDRDSGAIRHYPEGAFGPGPLNWSSRLFEDRQGRLWLTVHRGLSLFDAESDRFRYLPLEERSTGGSQAQLEVRAISQGRDGALWLATLEGAYRFDPATAEVVSYRHRTGYATSLSDDLVLDVLEDRTGTIWMATNSGLDRLDPRRQVFETHRHVPADSASLGEGSVLALDAGTSSLWVSTSGSGLSRLGLDDRRVERFAAGTGGLSHGVVWSVLEDREGIVWLGTEVGLDRLDPATGSFRHYGSVAGESGGLGRVSTLHEDAGGRLWLADVKGLVELDRRRGVLTRFELETGADPNPSQVLAIEDDPRRACLWLGGQGSELYRIEPESGAVETIRPEAGDASSSSPGVIVTLRLDDAGTLWLATLGGGLVRFDPEARRFRAYRQADGLPSDSIKGLEIDDDGRLWLMTQAALALFDPRTERVEVLANGPRGPFAARVHARDAGGRLYLGTASDGFVTFHPDQVTRDPSPPPAVVLTELRILNQPVAAGDPDSPLDRALHRTEVLTLDHRAYSFSLEFAALHLAAPSEHRFAYRLEGLDREWIETDASRRVASYSNLDPGDYLFQVKAASHEGVWNEEGATLRIHVLPPLWRTSWAYGLYALALIAAAGVVVRGQARKLARERAVAARERMANRRLREADRAKDQFLANTSHELRTPLYGIVGLAESLYAGGAGELPLAARHKLATIIASGHRLQSLVGDVLDFSRLKRGRLELARQPVEMRAAVDKVIDLAGPLADTKDLTLDNHVPADLPPADADPDRLQQVLLNLVANAIKFTKAGEVTVHARRLSERWLEVAVRDTGIGIAEEHHGSIFEVFEQADGSIERSHGGTGLGLAVSRQLVALHGGEIRVESAPGRGATFFFTLPAAVGAAPNALTRPAIVPRTEPALADAGLEAAALAEAPSEPVAGGGLEDSEPRGHILVVDDGPVNRLVLSEQLQTAGFAVTEAADGLQALELAAGGAVDLVVLDIMMPDMSGYETCRRLRRTFPLLELPILFLSAKDRPEDLQAGFAAGGSDYLTKPLARAELLARVDLHLEIVRLQRNLDRLLAERTKRVEVLSGLLPICASCKKIRDDEGYWEEVEV